MGDISALKYPRKSHRKQVTLPSHSVELAEFFGIMIGDGGINNSWQANITLNSIKDLDYSRYVYKLIKRLFSITPYGFTYKTKNALRILINSTSIVDFLISQGLLQGDKLAQGLSIPTWILQDETYKSACVRGLLDTDGCLYIHKHVVAKKPYRNIGLAFSSYSPRLIYQVAAIFEENGIMPHISTRGTDIYIYRAASVARYLDVFGSSNPRISSVYAEWKRVRAVEGARLESV